MERGRLFSCSFACTPFCCCWFLCLYQHHPGSCDYSGPMRRCRLRAHGGLSHHKMETRCSCARIILGRFWLSHGASSSLLATQQARSSDLVHSWVHWHRLCQVWDEFHHCGIGASCDEDRLPPIYCEVCNSVICSGARRGAAGEDASEEVGTSATPATGAGSLCKPFHKRYSAMHICQQPAKSIRQHVQARQGSGNNQPLSECGRPGEPFRQHVHSNCRICCHTPVRRQRHRWSLFQPDQETVSSIITSHVQFPTSVSSTRTRRTRAADADATSASTSFPRRVWRSQNASSERRASIGHPGRG